MAFTPQPYFIAIPVEDWKYMTYPVVEQGKYMISNYGNVFNLKRNVYVSKGSNISGYLTCALTTPGKPRNSYIHYVHRLVAWDWVLYNRDFDLQVNHIDGNKLNNCYLNLEWVTQSENTIHAYRTGLIKDYKGESHAKKLTEAEVKEICKMLEDPNIRYDDILKKFDNKISKSFLQQIVNGSRWKHVSSQYNIVPRTRTGEFSARSNLTDNDVHCICTLLQNPNISFEQIQKMFNDKIGINGVKHIAYGHVWTHISSQYNIPPRAISVKCPLGENSAHHTLTEEDVRQICQMLEDPSMSTGDIVDKMNNKVTKSAIEKILRGVNWKEVSKNYDFSARKKD